MELRRRRRGAVRSGGLHSSGVEYDGEAMEWLPELSEFLRIKSISGDAAHRDDVKRAGEWVCARVREAGGECELVDWHGQPLAIGEIRASGGGDAPTVLCYGHFDVAPPEPIELWGSDPFEPEVRGGYLYGRVALDYR